MGKRIIRALDGLLNGFIIAVCAVFLLVSGYSLLDNYLIYKNANDASLQAYRPKSRAEATARPETTPAQTPPDASPAPAAQMQFISDKQAGWLQVDDTTIDYPIMQGADNFEFLNIDPYGEFNLGGSIFMDSRNAFDLSDDYIVIYGHHMAFDSMFGALSRFTEKEYFDTHRTGRIVTRDGEYDLELFAVTPGEGNDPMFSPEGRTRREIEDYLNANAFFCEAFPQDAKIVALTTCWGETALSRLLVFGALRPVEGRGL